MAKPPSKPTGKQPPRPMAMDDSIAHVAVMRPNKRRRTTGTVPAADTVEEPPLAATPTPAPEPEPPAVAPPPEPKLPDLSRQEAEQLIQTQILPFVATLKTDYSAEHVVFAERAALDDALGKARRILDERRQLLAERLEGYAGPNVEQVAEAWDAAVIELGEIYLQQDHWAAEPETIVGEWRHKFATGPDGERLCITFYHVADKALRPRQVAQEIEAELLPPAVLAILKLVDWEKGEKIEREITEAEAGKITPLRAKLEQALAGVSGPQRAHYLRAYHGALGAVVTGSPENRFRSETSDPRLAALWIDLVAA